MTILALPTGFCPNQFSMRLAPVQRAHSSPFGGSEQVVDLLNDRWLVSLALPNRTHADAARIEAFVASMRGMTNMVNLFHFVRKVPRGTMRGTPMTINGPAPQGASNLLVAAAVGATLLAGDLIGVSGLLLQVEADCVASGAGSITVPIVNRLRRAIPSGTAVAWNRPTAPFRLISTPSVGYVPGYAESVSLDFVEAIA